jgi:hypothetical protein
MISSLRPDEFEQFLCRAKAAQCLRLATLLKKPVAGKKDTAQ